mgnify:CR=1 FL=1
MIPDNIIMKVSSNRPFPVLMIFLFTVGWSLIVNGQDTLLTVAEASGYTSTSTHDEVRSFIAGLERSSQYIRSELLAVSAEGREIPLAVIGNPLPAGPEDLANDDRMVVYIQANIHAGEVEGKEASLMLMRDLLRAPDSAIFKKLVLLVVPNLNADGNDKISPEHRSYQNGPVNGVGLRRNGQYLDLNRDAMKLESPEMRGVVTRVLNRWDPAVTVDCHTTNGSYHEEPITFTWMMNPNGNRDLINYMRDVMMPDVHRTLFEKYNVENVFYGEFIDRMQMEKGWMSYASEPRYMVNYIGVRNRLAILNENYVYAAYETRVKGCYHLLQTILEYVSDNREEIRKMLDEADGRLPGRDYAPGIPDSFAIEYEGRPTPEKVTIKAFEADTIPGARGYWRYIKTDRKRTVTVDYIADYYPVKSIPVPYAYLLTVPAKEVVANLRDHGIIMEELAEAKQLEVESFRIDELKGSRRLNQGHYTNSVKGEYEIEQMGFPAGTLIIRTNQPLGNLVSGLLEPQADDSMLKWNFFDRYLVPQWGGGYYPYPVYRLMEKEDLELHPFLNF